MITGAPRSVQIHRLIRPSFLFCLSLLTLSSLVATTAAAPGFWSNIYDAPTPSPEDGPPGAAHASRDKRLLPYQICGILGGYLGFVLIVLLLLLTVGRRLRRAAEMSPASLEMELIKSTNRMFVDETPISPASTTRGWFKNTFKKPSSVKSGSTPISPVADSFTSFDKSVLDNDKEARQREMERLYAAVMEHDARKSQTHTVEEQEDEEEYDEEADQEDQIQPAPRDRHADKRPPRLLMKQGDRSNPRSPASPVKAIYPPSSPRSNSSAGPLSPRQRLAPPGPMSPRNVPLPMSPGKPSSSLSSPRSLFSFGSGSKTRKALKNLRISGPIKDYPGVTDQDEARTPLSGRFYSNLPPPPSPPQNDGRPANTPGTAGTMDSEYAYEQLDKPQPLPMPRRGPLSPGFPPEQGLDAVLAAQSQQSAGSSASSLPLRSYNTDAAVPPTPTKVTYLDRRKDQLSLMTPRTGVPSTPYSPYMPFTPLTPVTPHLVTKKELKAKKKIEGRRVQSGDDLVKSSDDLWDSGY
jgi:hypothetical protein